MKQLCSGQGDSLVFDKIEVVYLHSLVNWLYAEKDKTWEEYLALSIVQQNSLIAEFENYIRK